MLQTTVIWNAFRASFHLQHRFYTDLLAMNIFAAIYFRQKHHFFFFISHKRVCKKCVQNNLHS